MCMIFVVGKIIEDKIFNSVDFLVLLGFIIFINLFLLMVNEILFNIFVLLFK